MLKKIESKIHKVSIKTNENKEQTFILNCKCLPYKGEQKDLGFFMTPNNWKLNAYRRCKTAWKAFYFPTKNVSSLAGKMTKLIAYYVVLTQKRKINKTHPKESWILSNS